MRKSAPYALFLIFFSFSGCAPQCHQWKLASIKGDCPCASYVKVYLPACNSFSGLEAELLCSDGDLQFFLNSKTLLLPCTADDPDHTLVKVTICEQETVYVADRLLGGQRLRLPEEAKEAIICALLECNEVDITTGRYEATLVPENFFKSYDKLVTMCY